MTSSPSDIRSFSDFQALLAQALQLPSNTITPDAHFISDLGLDSLRLIELVLWFQQQGFDIPLDQLVVVQTPGDAFRLIQQAHTES